MKYYSEILNGLFDSVEELNKAEAAQKEKEAEAKRKENEKKAREEEVEKAYENYKKTLAAFCKDYGAYTATRTNKGANYNSLIDAICDLI